MESVSPELALVDPALAERSRSGLADPGDTLARVDDLVAASRLASLARRSVEIPVPASARIEPAVHVSRSRRRRTAVFAGGAVGTLALALLVGVRVDLRGSPAGADTAPVVVEPVVEPAAPEVPPESRGAGQKKPPASTAPTDRPTSPETGKAKPRTPVEPQTEPPVTEPAPTVPPRSQGTVEPKSRTPVAPRAAQPRRFAWAPALTASAYHVELFRGSAKVFEADTRRPAITIPARWEFDGRTRTLEPGEYRWNVWPVYAGQRAARAIVQARFVAPTP